MNAPKVSAVRSILILKADRLISETILRGAREAWPDAEYRIESGVSRARAALVAGKVDMLITGLRMLEGDVCELVGMCARLPRAARRIAVVTGHRDLRVLALLRELPIDGAFDSTTEPIRNFGPALLEIQRGKKYFSGSFLGLLCGHESSGRSIFHQLTASELLILAVIGDGCDCKVAAERLNLKVESIRSVCRTLHWKLGVQHRSDLIRLAQQWGLVRITSAGVMRLGFDLLVEHYEASRPRGQLHTPFIDALCLHRRHLGSKA